MKDKPPATLILCEKPSAAEKVAMALGGASCRRRISRGVPYFEAERGGERLIVCSAIGHLYTVAQRTGEAGYPVWDVCWKPNYMVKRGLQRQRDWVQVLGMLASGADRFVNACDYDTEGSLIGYMALRYACGGAEARAMRMRFSTLVEKDLVAAYSSIYPTLDLTMVEAGRCRHEVDWLYGVNLSRALSGSAYRSGGSYPILSIGRVQGPTLKFIVEREREILTFVPAPFWEIKAIVEVGGKALEAEYLKKSVENFDEAEAVAAECAGKEAEVVEVSATQTRLSPPTPFNLADLQAEAYRHLRMTPRQTLSAAERLYLDALISYPRTGSQKLPEAIGFREIVAEISENPDYARLSGMLLSRGGLKPNEGNKTDPAHPAIYPTGVRPQPGLDRRSSRLYDLIVKRFLATFGESALRESVRAMLETGRHRFRLHGIRTISEGWTVFYKPYAKLEESPLPPLAKGQRVLIREVRSAERYTWPPPRFNPASLLRLMEEEGLGTKATRADIIETLYRRRYIAKERIEATPLSFDVIDIMERFCPLIIDVALTKRLEDEMELIEGGVKGREEVVREAVDYLKPALELIKGSELEVGRRLSEALRRVERLSGSLDTTCPECGSSLRVITSKKTGKRFIGCGGYAEKGCRFSLPIPQAGKLILLNRLCERCRFQLIEVREPGRRPYISCPRCYKGSKEPTRVCA